MSSPENRGTFLWNKKVGFCSFRLHISWAEVHKFRDIYHKLLHKHLGVNYMGYGYGGVAAVVFLSGCREVQQEFCLNCCAFYFVNYRRCSFLLLVHHGGCARGTASLH